MLKKYHVSYMEAVRLEQEQKKQEQQAEIFQIGFLVVGVITLTLMCVHAII